jgi:alpha-tubulin suppressor-like RCC1 family protein
MTFIPNYATTGWGTVAAGYQYACAINTTAGSSFGKAACWGDNGYGQIDSQIGSNTPRTLGNLWKVLAPGRFHTCGLRLDGLTQCWGRNDQGQIGDATHTNALTPVTVGFDPATVTTNVVSGDYHSCALQSDGSVWCWGNNHDGELATTRGWISDLIRVPDPT